MAREPEMQLPPERGQQASNLVTQVRHYRLITPLFGGGVNPQETDQITLVRASEVRGQLRFWWRATQGGQFGASIRAMKKAESALWGSTSEPSLVQVCVAVEDSGTILNHFPIPNQRPYPIGDPRSPIGYAAFPLRKGGGVCVGVRFTIAFTFPIVKRSEVETAIWAWETFGGIGARTRRGFGALDCLSIVEGDTPTEPLRPPTYRPEQVIAWLNDQITNRQIVGNWHEELPHLSPKSQLAVGCRSQDFNVYISREFPAYSFRKLAAGFISQADLSNDTMAQELISAMTAWYYSIEQLKAFRQSRTNNRGRSKWPEPDAIRSSKPNGFRGKHSKPMPKTAGINKFPRAAFGLPIIFQFKDTTIDPPKTALQGDKHERLASPLILRPLRCADGTFASIAIVLDGPKIPPGGLKLVNGEPNTVDTSPLTVSEATQIEPLRGETDVLKAFLKTL